MTPVICDPHPAARPALGVLLVVLGVLVVLEPQVLTWLAAFVLRFAGISVIAMGGFMRRMVAGASGG